MRGKQRLPQACTAAVGNFLAHDAWVWYRWLLQPLPQALWAPKGQGSTMQRNSFKSVDMATVFTPVGNFLAHHKCAVSSQCCSSLGQEIDSKTKQAALVHPGPPMLPVLAQAVTKLTKNFSSRSSLVRGLAAFTKRIEQSKLH